MVVGVEMDTPIVVGDRKRECSSLAFSDAYYFIAFSVQKHFNAHILKNHLKVKYANQHTGICTTRRFHVFQQK